MQKPATTAPDNRSFFCTHEKNSDIYTLYTYIYKTTVVFCTRLKTLYTYVYTIQVGFWSRFFAVIFKNKIYV